MWIPRFLYITVSCCAVWFLYMGCGGHTSQHRNDPKRYDGLPSTPQELLALAEQLTRPHPPTSLTKIDRALAALEAALAHPPPHPEEVLWRLARACFWMAENLSESSPRLDYASRGRDYAEQALKGARQPVEAYYYLALNLGKMAEATSSLKWIKPMLVAAEQAARIDASYDQAGPLRLMGKVYTMAPAWPISVGSPEKAIEVLQKAVAISSVPINQLFLGEAYYHDEQYKKARDEIKRALQGNSPGKLDARWRAEAQQYLRRIDSQLTSP